jgi:hypothetical protein
MKISTLIFLAVGGYILLKARQNANTAAVAPRIDGPVIGGLKFD